MGNSSNCKLTLTGATSLYAGMPMPDPKNDKEANSRAKEMDIFATPPSPEDPSLVIFLDIDGVLRRIEGNVPVMSIDGEIMPLDIRHRTFAPETLKALKYIVHRTGARIVLSSEWRRSTTLR